MRLIPFATGHVEDLATERKDMVRWKEMLSHVVPELSYTGVLNGHLIGSGGVVPMWDGVAEAWFVGSWRLSKNRFAAVRTLQKTMLELMDANAINRLQAHVRADTPEAVRFIEFLGFEREGLLREYGPDRTDHYVYARFS